VDADSQLKISATSFQIPTSQLIAVFESAGIRNVLVVSHGMKNRYFRKDFNDDQFVSTMWKRMDFGKNFTYDSICLLRLPQGITEGRMYPILNILDAGNISFHIDGVYVKIYNTIIHKLRKISRLSSKIDTQAKVSQLEKKIVLMRELLTKNSHRYFKL
jgi:hypothetical protein